ncbi:hypothetical protein [Melittangium boletus]|uniref:Uncharacterized protein n=1 Tax=Melittangium boletus DSM 14713 TaxID=1294270 RepID=A0A250I9L1_9BACT|nr:hypothetical protein [Melittangium boletus]ATB27861.1 hypothetical protein MEBOL_001306 [Melittangium boletus DSM 14713]
METTRIVRFRAKAPEAPASLASRPTPVLEPLPLERLALVALVLGRERAAALLDGLTESDATRARDYLAGFTALSSARRQARVAVEFGVRPDAAARLRQMMEDAPGVLRREIFRRLPSFHRSLFPSFQMEPADTAVPARVGTWAERLIREATR